MTNEIAPDSVAAAARARSRARRQRDWDEADRLKAEIEAAGWRVVDRGTEYELRPAVRPDVVVDGVVWHGSSGSVPSRLEEAPSCVATVVVVPWDELPEHSAETSQRIAALAPTEVALVTVLAGRPETGSSGSSPAGARSPGHASQTGRHEEGAPGPGGEGAREVVRMLAPVAPGAIANAGIRRAGGRVVIVIAAGTTPSADVVAPLIRALDDPSVAIAGGWGSATTDLRHRESVAAGDADLLDARCLAFRRDDVIARGPLDERFVTADGLAAWWSLALRDEGGGQTPRRALVVPDLPLAAAATGRPAAEGGPERPAASLDRGSRRDFYRLLDRFGRRPDLVGARPPVP